MYVTDEHLKERMKVEITEIRSVIENITQARALRNIFLMTDFVKDNY
jgi:transcription initiation factor IIE alpha subunit